MPMGDGRCSLCGYWHAPGSDHIGPLRTYGHCARCGNEHSVGPCPVVAESSFRIAQMMRAQVVKEPMRFPSKAERVAIARMVTNPSADDSPAAWWFTDCAQWDRRSLIEQAVRYSIPMDREWLGKHLHYHLLWPRPRPCVLCAPAVHAIRAGFRELTNGEGAVRPAAGR